MSRGVGLCENRCLRYMGISSGLQLFRRRRHHLRFPRRQCIWHIDSRCSRDSMCLCSYPTWCADGQALQEHPVSWLLGIFSRNPSRPNESSDIRSRIWHERSEFIYSLHLYSGYTEHTVLIPGPLTVPTLSHPCTDGSSLP